MDLTNAIKETRRRLTAGATPSQALRAGLAIIGPCSSHEVIDLALDGLGVGVNSAKLAKIWIGHAPDGFLSDEDLDRELAERGDLMAWDSKGNPTQEPKTPA